MKRPMNRNSSIVRIAPLSLVALLLVAGCGSHEDDHPHGPDGPDGDHAHDDAEQAAAGHAEEAHDHGDGSHAHDAPETEAIYADDRMPAEPPQTGAEATAPAPEDGGSSEASDAETSDSEAHTHGDGSGHEH